MDTALLGLRVVLSLACVLGLIWFAGRKLQGTAGVRRQRTVPLSVLGRQSLGKGAGVALVEVAGRVLLLGVGEQGVSVLTEVDVDAVPAATGRAPERTGQVREELDLTTLPVLQALESGTTTDTQPHRGSDVPGRTSGGTSSVGEPVPADPAAGDDAAPGASVQHEHDAAGTTPTTGTSSDTPVTPDAADTLDASVTPDASDTLDAAVTPDASDTLDAAVTPDAADTSDTAEAAGSDGAAGDAEDRGPDAPAESPAVPTPHAEGTARLAALAGLAAGASAAQAGATRSDAQACTASSGALAGSILSPDTWRRAVDVVQRRTAR
ncbi:flagellar biosynthetic protein FliO [Cellulomonas aerilata]|uniref:flagellar biosynthetic protein FliO n=1 Tax=Cellulomonas aerilata TaxID=515326 RepID=UPI0031E197F2